MKGEGDEEDVAAHLEVARKLEEPLVEPVGIGAEAMHCDQGGARRTVVTPIACMRHTVATMPVVASPFSGVHGLIRALEL